MGQRKSDPHQRLEALERWSARATLLILVGIVAEIVQLLWFPHDWMERLWSTIANSLIAVGLIVEYVIILRAIVATGEANRESEEATAEANARLAEAQLELVRLNKKVTPREISNEQAGAIVAKIARFPGAPFAIECDPAAEYGFVNRVAEVL